MIMDRKLKPSLDLEDCVKTKGTTLLPRELFRKAAKGSPMPVESTSSRAIPQNLTISNNLEYRDVKGSPYQE